MTYDVSGQDNLSVFGVQSRLPPIRHHPSCHLWQSLSVPHFICAFEDQIHFVHGVESCY
ncbi:hypothetical protein M419DRAFT_135289 [Trichoderma reesei RUT C-30]|uniref:Uncharacterized protein n=1 Tax=Hypocrea jecorina (strain ATCC 56765 / BCRC 32924 / NRRL 11460 / Rut C-30) TaxID=1344414 RepID=A0A024SJN3_HYPJR|nr:hypothetical protein M419DRAFT_135289 [Trichoderma reesei RUT C-30]